MAKTLRSQNKCNDCGDTWYPRGRNLSRRCPNCGSKNVQIHTGSIVGTVVLVFILAIWGFFKDDKKAIEPNVDIASSQGNIVEQSPSLSEEESQIDSQIDQAAQQSAPELTPVDAAYADIQSEFRIKFSQWADSEKELRDRYVKLMNASDASLSDIEIKRSEYHGFTNEKNKKCGDLDGKHSEHINSDISELSFSDEEIVRIECHRDENLSRIKLLDNINSDAMESI